MLRTITYLLDLERQVCVLWIWNGLQDANAKDWLWPLVTRDLESEDDGVAGPVDIQWRVWRWCLRRIGSDELAPVAKDWAGERSWCSAA
jgi:hypothetical protein